MAQPAAAASDDDVDPTLVPRLVLGETAQGFLTAAPKEAETVTHPFKDSAVNALALRRDMEYVLTPKLPKFLLNITRQASVVRVGPDVSDEGLDILVANGLEQKAPAPCQAWKAKKAQVEKAHREQHNDFLSDLQKQLDADRPEITAVLYKRLAQFVVPLYPSVHEHRMSCLRRADTLQ